MQCSIRMNFFTVNLFILMVSVIFQSAYSLPPLFRENPNLRINQEIIIEDPSLNYRLPNTIIPIHYNIDLTTNVHSNDPVFKGIVNIKLRVLNETNEIILHQRQLNIERVSIENDNENDIDSFNYEKLREFLTITTKKAMPAESELELIIEYNGTLRNDNGGFYLSTYSDEFNKTQYLATTQFESTDARHAFPCFDEPQMRATFTITIHHSVDYNAISNMEINLDESSPGSTTFKQTPNMPTYLIAFIISKFEYSEGVLNALPQRIYSRPGSAHEQEWALVSGMLIIDRLAKYYGVEFTLPKLYQVAVPDFAAGAMENWGLATYREEYLLFNEEKSTINTQTNIANIIAHEYCHQWFGNLVAVEWWTYLWLKEGFATLFSYKATDSVYPEWDIFQMFHVDDYQRALNNDGLNTTRAMTHYVETPNEISSLYDSVSYSKAGSVLSMWQHALTEEVFQTGLHNYLTAKQFSNAREEDLFTALQNSALEHNYKLPGTIIDMMSTWTRQAGVPLLYVQRNYNNGTFTVTQQSFSNNENVKDDKLWYIPFNYVQQSHPDFRNTEASYYLSANKTIEVYPENLSDSSWLLLNKQSTGYYRINYDERNWLLIISGLKSKAYKIHPRNRAQLMHDAYRFSSSNRLSHSILLELLTYLQNENQYAPWATANGIINTFNRYLSSDSEYISLQRFIGSLVQNIYDTLGTNDIPGEHHFNKYTRTIAINLACLAGIESCLNETNEKLNDQIKNNIEIEPNLQSTTFCNGLKKQDQGEFDYVYQLLMTSQDQAQRRLLISSLGCTQQEHNLKKFAESSIDHTNELRTQERPTLLGWIYSRGELGLLVSIDFLNKNWEVYGNLTSGFSKTNPLDDDIRSMSQYVVNKDQQEKLLELVNMVKHSDYVTEKLEEIVKSNIAANMEWLDKNRNSIMTWIANYSKSSSMIVNASYINIYFALIAVAISRWKLF